MASDKPTKRDLCPKCRKPYTGKLNFTTAEIEIIVNDRSVMSAHGSEATYIHDDGRKCRVPTPVPAPEKKR